MVTLNVIVGINAWISLPDSLIDITAGHPDEFIIFRSFVFTIEVELELAVGYIF